MEERNHSEMVPKQETGIKIDVEESVELRHPEEAKVFFKTVSARLLDINNWKKLAGALSADFQLVDQNGHKVDRPVKEGDLVRIDIPGPGSETGDGYDWVAVEKVEEISNSDMHNVSIRVRPTSSPLNEKTGVAHFYSEQSTSTFTITQKGNKITAGIFDRNTEPNTSAGTVADQVRDTAVGLTAIAAFSRIQWNNLAKGLIKREEQSKKR